MFFDEVTLHDRNQIGMVHYDYGRTSLYNGHMRNLFRNALIIISLLLAVFVPFILSGYTELDKASTASSLLESAEHYQAAARRIVWRPDLFELAGHYFYHAKEYAQADAAYQKALKRKALSPDGWVAWGDVVYLSGDTQRAAEIWEQGLAQPNPSENLYSRLAEMYQRDKQYAKAAEYLQRYVEVHVEDASAHYRLGLLLTLSNPNQAFSELTTASQLDPQFDPAVQALRTALNLSAVDGSPSEQKVFIGRGLGLVNEWELANVAFKEAAQLDENNAEAWAWLGESKQQTTGDDAFADLEHALSLNPDSSVVRGLRGLYFQRVGNHRQALIEFQAAAILEPENPTWYVSIGEEYSQVGDLILALQAYQYVTLLLPGNASYWNLLAEFCVRNGINIRDVGLPAAQKAVTLEPNNPQILDTLGWLLVLDERYYEAERFFNQALGLDPSLASAHFHLALLYFQQDDRVAAYDQLIQARDLGSTEAEEFLRQYFP